MGSTGRTLVIGRGIVALAVLTLAGSVPVITSVSASGASGAVGAQEIVRWDGHYEGEMGGVEEADTEIIANELLIDIDGLDLSGSVSVRFEQVATATFDVGICGLVAATLTEGDLTGIPVEGEEITWNGTVDVGLGSGDPQKQDCAKIGPARSVPSKIDITVGSNGLRGSLEVNGQTFQLTAERLFDRTGSDVTTTTRRTLQTTTTDPEDAAHGVEHDATLAESLGTNLETVYGGEFAQRVADRIGENDRIAPFDAKEGAGMSDLGRRTAARKDKTLAHLALTAVLLGRVMAKDEDENPRPVFPNVHALGPVLVKLAGIASAAEDTEDRAKAERTLQRLLELALELDLAKS